MYQEGKQKKKKLKKMEMQDHIKGRERDCFFYVTRTDKPLHVLKATCTFAKVVVTSALSVSRAEANSPWSASTALLEFIDFHNQRSDSSNFHEEEVLKWAV